MAYRTSKTFADYGIELQSGASGEVYTLCPECSSTRKKNPRAKCLGVNVEKGAWKCHHCGYAGGLQSGVESRPNPHEWKRQVYTRPEYHQTPQGTAELGHWLRQRGLDASLIDRYQLSVARTWFPDAEDFLQAVQIPYYRDGQVINIKSRAMREKHFRQTANAEKILYGLDDIKGKLAIVVVEGECDKWAMAMANISACVSVPDGAPPENAKPSDKKFEYLETCASYFEHATKIILACDADGPGQKLQDELGRRLGFEKCWRVTWPDGIKDANDCLQKRGVDGLQDCITKAEPWPIDGLVCMSDMVDALLTYMREGPERGRSTGWTSLGEYFTIRPGELTVVTGVPSHGKSNWLDALAIQTADSYGWHWTMCAPESLPVLNHLDRLTALYIGKSTARHAENRVNDRDVIAASSFFDRQISILADDDMISIDTVLKRTKALLLRKGVNALVVDPWNEFEHKRPSGMSETDYTGETLSKLKRFARMTQIHVFLVAHPAKLRRNKDGFYPIPGPQDLHGSANWYNKPDNILCVWRNVDETDPQRRYHVLVIAQKIKSRLTGQQGETTLVWNPVNSRYRDAMPGELAEEDA
jgi:twinkle protein